MYLCRIQSDQLYTWSDEYPERAHCRLTKTSQRSCAPTAPAASGPARLPHRALQTVWQAGMQMHRRPRPWSQVLSVDKLPQRCWIVSSSRRSCRFYNASGTGRFLITATGFGPGVRRIRRWQRRSSTLLPVTAGWWILISRNFSIGSITTN